MSNHFQSSQIYIYVYYIDRYARITRQIFSNRNERIFIIPSICEDFIYTDVRCYKIQPHFWLYLGNYLLSAQFLLIYWRRYISSCWILPGDRLISILSFIRFVTSRLSQYHASFSVVCQYSNRGNCLKSNRIERVKEK